MARDETFERLLETADRAADWMTRYCCSHDGFERGRELRAALDEMPIFWGEDTPAEQ